MSAPFHSNFSLSALNSTRETSPSSQLLPSQNCTADSQTPQAKNSYNQTSATYPKSEPITATGTTMLLGAVSKVVLRSVLARMKMKGVLRLERNCNEGL